MVAEVNKIIAGELLNHRSVVIPGVGTLYVAHRGARRLSRQKIAAPRNEIDFRPSEEGVSLVELIRRAAGCDEAQAQAVFGRWLTKTREGEVLTLEGIGILRHRAFTPEPAFAAQLNPAGEEVVTCRARGRFRKEGVSPLVGDRVEITVSGTEGMVGAIGPRRNVFSRPAVANIDQLVIVASNAIPQTDPYLIDRMTAIAALKGCEVLICINKSDLDHADELCAIYEKAGLPFLLTSAETGEGIAELRERISGKLSAFTGNSGVGKSSLLNALDPRFSVQVGEVSQALGRGRHTTRHVELYTLSGGAEIIDTPGFSSFDTDELGLALKERLPETFLDFAPYLDGCRFVGCSHTKEKGCAVLEAVRAGKLSASRHASYLRLYNELKDLREWSSK